MLLILRNCLHNLHRVIILYYPMSCQLVISDKIFELIEYLLVLSTLFILSIEFYILALTTLLTEFLDILGWWCCLNERISWFKVMKIGFPKIFTKKFKNFGIPVWSRDQLGLQNQYSWSIREHQNLSWVSEMSLRW